MKIFFFFSKKHEKKTLQLTSCYEQQCFTRNIIVLNTPIAAARMGNHLQVPKTKKFWKPN